MPERMPTSTITIISSAMVKPWWPCVFVIMAS
jgi:hypothetical protein